MSKEAMKLALEALEYIEHNYMSLPAPAEKAITALREALAEQPAQKEFVSPGGGYVPAIPVQQALDKMAENARELGLDYEPLAGTQVSKVWWDGEKLMAKPIPLKDFYEPAQQEPVAWLVECGGDSALVRHTENFPGIFAGNEFNKRPLVFGDKSPPTQRKPLTDEQISNLWCEVSNTDFVTADTHEFARAIEAAYGIKENT